MKTSDLSKNLTAFFKSYLPGIRNLSANTILSYRDCFRLFLMFCRDECAIKPEKLSLDMIDDALVTRFLGWVEGERGCSVATRNQRLVAIHAFFRYVQVQEPPHFDRCQRILLIPCKKCPKPIVDHLTPEQVKELLAAPDASSPSGRRDVTLLSVLYDTGARVQELCDLRVRDIRFEYPSTATLTGKGSKIRHVPIMGNTTALLRSYMEENALMGNGRQDAILFVNQRKGRLSRGGISHILKKYAMMVFDETRKAVTPHIVRHSKAVHLYQSGVNLIYIRDFLG
ncbi:MAG: site-specific integrase, partial [Coriobacteriales bacterium]|nr:site-specific integrase [Coriobacteriales bacterium]